MILGTHWSADTWPAAKAVLGALAERGRLRRVGWFNDMETPVLNRAELVAALGFLQLNDQPPEVATLRLWLDSWTGLGAVLEAMVKQGYDIALTRNGDAGWRALFFPSSFTHESRAGSAWGTTPWQAVQDAAWQTLEPRRPR